MEYDDKSLLMPMTSIKTNHSDDEDEDRVEPEHEVSLESEDAAANTVMLFETSVKVEPSTEGEDPLNILNKLDIKMETPEVRVEFMGEFNESDFLYSDAVAADSTPLNNVKSSVPNKAKRIRISVTELKSRKGSIWSNTKPVANGNDDLLMQPLIPKGKGPARQVSNILEAWHLLMDEPIMSNILKHTNEEIRKRKIKAKAPTSLQRSTDIFELRAWIGLNYLCGVFRLGGGSLEELWTPELGNGVFRACMSLKRFEYLSDCLRLSEKLKNTAKISSSGPLQDVSNFWEKFVINCRSYYAASGNCTLHESIVDMESTNFPEELKQSLPNELGFSGIRLSSLHDSKTRYMCNAIISPVEAPLRDEVMALVCDIKGTKRIVTLPPRYTSLELANNLEQYELRLIGCIAPNSEDYPVEFASGRGSQYTNRLYAGASTMIVPESDGLDALITYGISDKINSTKLYAATVVAGKRYLESSACFSTVSAFAIKNGSKECWTLRFFHTVLDFACLNAWLLFRLSQHGVRDIQQRDFQRQLGLFLTQQHLKRRLQRNSKIPLQLKLLISEILGDSADTLIAEAVTAAAQASSAGAMPLEHGSLPGHIQLLAKTTPKRNRCRFCPSKNNIKTRWQCQQCGRALCLSHMIMRCDECTGLKKNQPEANGEKDDFFK